MAIKNIKYDYFNSNGNYEAFVTPPKPKDVEKKHAWIVGGGIAGLATAFFLIRDGQMSAKKIEIFEELDKVGGSLDGSFIPEHGFVLRGGREMENHYECTWDMFRSVPSDENPEISILDEFYRLNQEDPNFSYCRLLSKPGQRKSDDGKYSLKHKHMKQIYNLTMKREKDLNNVRIDEVFDADFFESNFWYYWASMFAFETWHSAAEMRRYLMRFIHHIDGLPDFSALKFTRYNQYESFVVPLKRWLTKKGVIFHKNTEVKNIVMKSIDKVDNRSRIKIAEKIIISNEEHGLEEIALTIDDLVFVTNGSITESTTYGDNKNAPIPNWNLGSSWKLWVKLAEQDSDFGRPERFFKNLPERAWHMSSTVMVPRGPIIDYIMKISKRDPFTGKTVTGGIVTPINSKWGLSYTINRQPQFQKQPKDQIAVWIYALFSDKPGDFIKKLPTECNGNEITQEWLYHMGVPEDQIKILADTCVGTPCYMPFVTSYFQPRKTGDRPEVLPKGTVNIAFLGNFAEVDNDVVFTMEYSVRTAMMAVYGFLGIQRGVPEVYPSVYDIRSLLTALYYMKDKKKLTEMPWNWFERRILKSILRRFDHTLIEELLIESKLLPGKVTGNK